MHHGHRLSLKAKGTDLEGLPQARVFASKQRKCRTPEGDLPSLCPQKGRLESKRWGGCAALSPAQGSEYETVTGGFGGSAAPEGGSQG